MCRYFPGVTGACLRPARISKKVVYLEPRGEGRELPMALCEPHEARMVAQMERREIPDAPAR